MDLRIRRLFEAAMRASHERGRVEIHLGENVWKPMAAAAGFDPDDKPVALWGFRVVCSDDPDHISIHSVQIIT